MPWIQNIPLAAVAKRHHIAAKPNSMLIQIVDPGTPFPVPAHEFREVHQFEFLDVEEDGMTNDGSGNWVDCSDQACTPAQAAELVRLLQHALDNRMDVIVHCHAGICRSGAVAEVGVMMGFWDTNTYRSPNLLVKRLMMQHLGWTYD